eukprot:CAMPEP_0177605122 /NCGR_PEP_ID=MMETSP0419_2-20121207/16519_1 /TAXON_ID=582737 /ORGANISM="Tetraselmis sp., Strain GSL018" /LENGTH=87 /DNA_ID=CAMNT_0019099223 /DNA_START=290 /DNA_END=550 /DNA_ORIENTATION=+
MRPGEHHEAVGQSSRGRPAGDSDNLRPRPPATADGERMSTNVITTAGRPAGQTVSQAPPGEQAGQVASRLSEAAPLTKCVPRRRGVC